MVTATATRIDEEAIYRQHTLAGMKSSTFKNLFFDEFKNLREAIRKNDAEEIKNTIEALEACAVSAAEMFDTEFQRAN